MHQNARQDALKIPGSPSGGANNENPDHPLPPITAYHLTALFMQAES